MPKHIQPCSLLTAFLFLPSDDANDSVGVCCHLSAVPQPAQHKFGDKHPQSLRPAELLCYLTFHWAKLLPATNKMIAVETGYVGRPSHVPDAVTELPQNVKTH